MNKIKNIKKIKQRILITIGIAVILVFSFYFISAAITKYTGYSISQADKDDDFKDCLLNKNIKLFINTNDVLITLKSLNTYEFLDSFLITNCNSIQQNCFESGINSFPTFIINGNIINKDITVQELSEYSLCKRVNIN
jgi:hypothetical protein